MYKSLRWRIAVRLSCIWDAWCLKVKLYRRMAGDDVGSEDSLTSETQESEKVRNTKLCNFKDAVNR